MRIFFLTLLLAFFPALCPLSAQQGGDAPVYIPAGEPATPSEALTAPAPAAPSIPEGTLPLDTLQPIAPPPAVPQPPAPPEPMGEPAAPRVARALPATVADRTARLQIFLDQKQFGPGKIDGAPGEFTAKALVRYRMANGLPLYDDLNYFDDIPLDEIHPVYTTYTITEADLRQVGPVPSKPQEQAKLQKMPYSSLLKFVVERFHSDPNFLQQLNPTLNLNNLQPGDVVRVPNVLPFRIEEVKAVAKMPAVPAYQNRRIEIDTREKLLDLYEGDTLLATFPITPGSSSLPAPAGTWRILGIATMPWFRWDEGVLKRGVRTNEFYNIPAGPSNPVGVVWIGLNRRSIGLHGTNNPLTIGRASSHGCIRLANWDAIRLVQMISPGITVVIDGPSAKRPADGVKVSQTGVDTVREER